MDNLVTPETKTYQYSGNYGQVVTIKYTPVPKELQKKRGPKVGKKKKVYKHNIDEILANYNEAVDIISELNHNLNLVKLTMTDITG